MNIKIDTKAIDKAVKDMNLFDDTKNAIALYKAEENKLDKKELLLKQKQQDLQIEHTTNLLDQQTTDDVGELVYLNKQARDIVNETAIISTMLECLNEAKTDLKIKYAPIFQEAITKDLQAKGGKYDVTEIIVQLRYTMLEAISVIGEEMALQYKEVSPDILEVFEDKEVLETYPRMRYAFNQEMWRPTINMNTDRVLDTNDFLYAKMGFITSRIGKPQGVKNEL
jgi:hypothetical protein